MNQSMNYDFMSECDMEVLAAISLKEVRDRSVHNLNHFKGVRRKNRPSASMNGFNNNIIGLVFREIEVPGN